MSCHSSHSIKRKSGIIPGLLSTAFLGFASIAYGQTTQLPANLPMAEPGQGVTKQMVMAPRVATGNDLYCAGYITADAISASKQIIGAEDEDRLAYFGQGDTIYTNIGGGQGAKQGALFSILRPMGKYASKFDDPLGKPMGTFVKELGIVRILEVQGQTSTARIVFSCDDVRIGDVLVPFEPRESPASVDTGPLPRYKATSGKNAGRILMQRNQRELLAPRDVVYIDLGKDNGVKPGDTFTIFRRKPDDGNITSFRDDEVGLRRSGGYPSDKYKGGEFSNDHPYQGVQSVKDTRPAVPPKVVGELVVISTQAKTATAIVTKATQEIHPGDRIETLR